MPTLKRIEDTKGCQLLCTSITSTNTYLQVDSCIFNALASNEWASLRGTVSDWLFGLGCWLLWLRTY
jgi:hypothetical protein